MIIVTAENLDELRVKLRRLFETPKPARTEPEKPKCSKCDGSGKIPDINPIYAGWRYCPECKPTFQTPLTRPIDVGELLDQLESIKAHIHKWPGSTALGDRLYDWYSELTDMVNGRKCPMSDIRTRPATKEYRDNFDKVFKRMKAAESAKVKPAIRGVIRTPAGGRDWTKTATSADIRRRLKG